MNNQVGKSGTVRIDLKERCICISKDILCLIGDPNYIQFFINRKTKVMFMFGHDTKVVSGIAVNPRVYTDTKFKYKMKRTAFVEAIDALCGWENCGKYQLSGTSYADRVARFSFDEAKRLDCDMTT